METEYDFSDFETLSRDLEAAIRFALRFDLEWHPDDARVHAEELANHVTARFKIRTGL